jgi:vancomycin permeability regulator SanA
MVRILVACASVLLAGTASALAAGAWVTRSTSPYVYRDLASVPERPAGIVFGAGVRDGVLSSVLRERVDAGIALYRAGKVRKLLMTGDNGRREYDEVTAMKAYAVERGVPPRDVVRDYAGFRTYDSCFRARAIFGVDHAVLITQEYHLPRAIFTARSLGIDAVGYAAEPGAPPGLMQRFKAREVLAAAAAALDVSVLRRPPKYLGPPEPLFANEHDSR